MRDTTHNGNIGTDELTSPGYVWLSCDHYGLPDNTIGKVGYHVVYRPLCGNMYTGNELITDEIREEIRAHYDEIKERKEAKHNAERDAMLAMSRAATTNPVKPSPMEKMICKHCGTVCYGDCQG